MRYVRSPESFSSLVPLGNNRFVFEDATPPAYVTITESGMVFEDSNGTVRFERVQRQPGELADMASLAGLYVSDSISTTYRLSVCEGEIWATNAVQDHLRFSPVAPDIYRSNGWFFRSIRVLRDEAGGIFGFDAGNVGASGIRFIKVTSPHLQPPRFDECQTIKPNARG